MEVDRRKVFKMNFKEIEPSYKPLHPRPVYLIVSGRIGERLNVMAASWVMPVSEEPLRIAIAVERDAYTFDLIEEYGEFTVNVVDHRLMEKVWRAGTMSGRSRDKIREIGLELEDPLKTRVPGVREALAIIECKVWSHVDSGEVRLYVADVLSVRVKPEYYNERYGWDIRKANILMHLTGRAFTVPGKLLVVRRQ